MKKYLKNLKILEEGNVYSKSMEHDACGVGLIASTEGKKKEKKQKRKDLHVKQGKRRKRTS